MMIVEALRMEKKQPRRAPTSWDAEGSGVARSQLRKRFDLGGDTSGATHPNVPRRTARPDGEDATFTPNERPTIPTPRPRLALNAIPRRLVDEREMMQLPLDHRAAFVLMSIDGKTAIRSLIDITGMAPEEVLVLIERLVELKAVAIL